MWEWKASEEVQNVHESLYQPSDPNDPESDTFLALIIKTVFPPKKSVQSKMQRGTIGFGSYIRRKLPVTKNRC